LTIAEKSAHSAFFTVKGKMEFLQEGHWKGGRPMNTFGTLPAGVRLDAWPDESPSQAPEDAPEIAQLREELRKSMPQVAEMLEMLTKLRPIRDLKGRLAAPQPAGLITKRS
jgi:hypothetical protein